MSEGISTEINSGMQVKENARATIEKKVRQVVNDIRKNPATKKVALTATGGLIFFSTACGIGRPPEISSVPFVPSTPTVEVLSGQQGETGLNSSATNQTQDSQTPQEDKDMQTRFMEAAEKERKQRLEALKINETLREISPKSAIIDYQFLAVSPQINMIKSPMDEETLLRFMLKDAYIGREQLETEFGTDFWDKKGTLEKIEEKYSKEVGVAYGFLQRYHNHGEKVSNTEEKTLEIFGFKRPPVAFYPLQNSLNPEDIQVRKDELENIGYFINIKPESVINAIREIKDSHPEITRFNLSIHIGPQGFYYEEKEKVYEVQEPQYQVLFGGNGESLYFPGAALDAVATPNGVRMRTPSGEIIEPFTEEEWETYKARNTKIIVSERNLDVPDIKEEDAYTPEKAKDNLPKIFQVANTFSDSLFFAAAGNNTDDLRGLKNEQPKNLIFFAQWNSYKNGPQSKIDGADIYVDNYFLGHDAGSSFSTPTLTAVADILESQGYNNEQIREKLFESCDKVSYERYDEKAGKTFTYSANLFNPQKFKTIVETLKASQEAKATTHN
ncbi:MAG: hypothetical protein Q7K55_08165 [Candidatus Levybacteria bacterium]|nr:hypothetical protein [Candidatus Levybacteria bacterium]